jgi:hypothetical protein
LRSRPFDRERDRLLLLLLGRELSREREEGEDERADGRSEDRSEDRGVYEGRSDDRSDERGVTEGRETSRSRLGVYEGLSRSTSRSLTVGRSGTDRVSGRRVSGR